MINTVMVFTSKPLETMFNEGGSGHWAANKMRLAKCEFLVATKSHLLAAHFPHDNVLRGTGFLVGKISNVVDAPEDGRYIIQFSEYAEVDFPDAWPGHRNPVAYFNISDLEKKFNFSLKTLNWKPFQSNNNEIYNFTKSLTIDEAKRGLAKGLGVHIDCIEIKITV